MGDREAKTSRPDVLLNESNTRVASPGMLFFYLPELDSIPIRRDKYLRPILDI